MKIDLLTSTVNETNTYLIQAEKNAIVVDVPDCRQLCRFIRNNDLHVAYIYLTHEHWDHIYGLEELRSVLSAPVICSQECNMGIQSEKWNLSKYIKILEHFKGQDNITISPFKAKEAEVCFADTYVLDFFGTECRFFSLKGHSRGSSVMMVENKLFAGDSILNQEEDIFRMPGSSKKEFCAAAIPVLEHIADEMPYVEVFPGHGRKMILQKELKKFKKWKEKQ